jgi:hypothetical protein
MKEHKLQIFGNKVPRKKIVDNRDDTSKGAIQDVA